MPEEAVIDAPEQAANSPTPRSPFFDKLVQQVEGNMSAEPSPELTQKAPPETPAKPPAKPEPPKEQKPPAQPPQQPLQQKEVPKDDEKVFTSPKAADWKKLKGERDEWQKKATEHETTAKTHAEKYAALEKEHTEFKTRTTIDPKEIEALKKDHEEAQARLARVALQETPKFKAHFDSRFEAAIKVAMSAVGKEHAEVIKGLMELPSDSKWRTEQIDQVLEGMTSQFSKLQLSQAITEFDKARDERGKELDKHKENLRELKAVEQKEAQQKQERDIANRKVMLAETLKQATKFDAFKESDDPEHNIVVAKNRKLVEDFVMGGDVPDSVVLMLPVLASEGERLQKVVPTLHAKITELEEALAKYKTSTPSLEGQGAPKQEGDRIKGYVDQVMEQMGQMPGSQKQR